MKLIIKNLKQVPYEVDVPNEQTTVKELKQIIEQTHKFEADKLKILYNGVILDDTRTLESYQIKDSFVLIMMGSRLKIENAQKPAEQPKVSTQENVNQPIPQQPVNQPQPSSQPSQPQQPVNQPQQQPQSRPAPDYSNQINQLVDMGFPRSEVESAVRAARGNLELAVEFLSNGIPSNLPMDFGEGDDQNPQGPMGDPMQGGEQDTLKTVASIIKVLCMQNPDALQGILMNIQQTDPGLMELIRSREEEFRNLISQPVTEEDTRTYRAFSQQVLGGRMGMGGPGMSGQPMGGHPQGPGGRGGPIQVTKEEYEAITRLKELGFSEAEAAQAYMAFDKNEDLAANFLFENKANEDYNFVIRDQPQQPQNSAFNQPQPSAFNQPQPNQPSAAPGNQPQSQANPQNEEKKEEEKKEEEKKNE